MAQYGIPSRNANQQATGLTEKQYKQYKEKQKAREVTKTPKNKNYADNANAYATGLTEKQYNEKQNAKKTIETPKERNYADNANQQATGLSVNRYEQLKAEQQAREVAKTIAARQQRDAYFGNKEEQAKQEAQIKKQAMKDLEKRQADEKAIVDRSIKAAEEAVNGKSSDTVQAFSPIATYQEYFNRLQNGNSIDNNIKLNQQRRDQVIAEKASSEVNDVPATKDKLAWIKKKMNMTVTEAPKSMKAQLEREAREMEKYKPFEILE